MQGFFVWCHQKMSSISKWLYIFALKNRNKRNLPLLLHLSSESRPYIFECYIIGCFNLIHKHSIGVSLNLVKQISASFSTNILFQLSAFN